MICANAFGGWALPRPAQRAIALASLARGAIAPGGEGRPWREARVYSQAVGNTLSNIRCPNVVGPTYYQCFYGHYEERKERVGEYASTD